MMTNKSRVVFYTGITNSLEVRVWQHRNRTIEDTKKYRVDRLVYYETYDIPRDAISREKEIKGWRRSKKKCAGQSDEPEVDRPFGDALSRYVSSLASLGMTNGVRVILSGAKDLTNNPRVAVFS